MPARRQNLIIRMIIPVLGVSSRDHSAKTGSDPSFTTDLLQLRIGLRLFVWLCVVDENFTAISAMRAQPVGVTTRRYCQCTLQNWFFIAMSVTTPRLTSKFFKVHLDVRWWPSAMHHIPSPGRAVFVFPNLGARSNINRQYAGGSLSKTGKAEQPS